MVQSRLMYTTNTALLLLEGNERPLLLGKSLGKSVEAIHAPTEGPLCEHGTSESAAAIPFELYRRAENMGMYSWERNLWIRKLHASSSLKERG